jgi:hypothetical protein
MKIEFTGTKKEKKKLLKYLSKKKMKFSELKAHESQSNFNESKKITLNINKTDAEWFIWLDKTAIKYVPKWYTFLNWVILLGLLNYLSESSNDWRLKSLYFASLVGMFWYLQGYFYSLEFDGIPFIKKERTKRIISFFMSGLLATSTFWFLQTVIPLFEK